jgi:cytochrome c oxidase subunit 1
MGLGANSFIINFFWSMRHGKKVDDNPWEATTLEWTAPSPPPHGNFATRAGRLPRAVRIQPAGPAKDYTMQDGAGQPDDEAAQSRPCR